jgi:hypothetical protein
MIFASGPYSSTDPEEKKARVKAIASACIKIMQSGSFYYIARLLVCYFFF